MPIYEYRCRQCNAGSEHLLKKASDTPPSCPHCGAGDMERVLSAPSALTSGRTSDVDRPLCGGGAPCCGLGTPCATPPCEEE
jgi:putative FmdB family regulatory protein